MFYQILASVIIFAILATARLYRSAMAEKQPEDGDETTKPYAFRAFKYTKINAITPAQQQPLARSGHRIVADSANLYSFGGYNPQIPSEYQRRREDEEFPLFQELWRYNFATCEWSEICMHGTLPMELASNAVVRLGSNLMVYGGTGSPFGQRCSNALYICSLKDDGDDALCSKMFEIIATGQLPLPQYGQALVYHNSYIYTIGGTTGFNYTCDIHRFNLATRMWEPVYICKGHKQDEPLGRYRHEVAFYESDIYILGGGTAECAYDMERLPAFNVEKREWRVVKTRPDPRDITNALPGGRRCHGAVQVDHEVFVCGGFDGEEVFRDLWRLDLRTRTWRRIDTCLLPHPTYFHSTAVTPEGRMYIFGGIISHVEQIKRNNWIYSAWLRIPKLSEMCWEALLHYRPDIAGMPKEQLVGTGLPRHFVERIQ